MTNNTNQLKNKKVIDIHDRIYKFVIRVMNLTKALPQTSQNFVLINQISRSVTSIGANDQEADGTESRKDFIHCYTLVRKESKETNYWLSLIADTNPSIRSRMEPLRQEGKELVKIVSSIVQKTKQNC